MNQRRILNILVIVGIILAIGAIGYFVISKLASQPTPVPTATPTPTPTQVSVTPQPPTTNNTSDWKKYKDNWGIVEFLYPSSVEFSASVIVFVPPDNFDNWLAENPLPGSGSRAQTLISSKDLSFGNVQGKKRIFNLELGRTINPLTGQFEITNRYKHTEVSVTDQKKLLVIDFDWEIGDEEQEQKIIDQIISTVKFFDVKPVIIADWKAYKNERYGFEFRYPIEYTVEETGDSSEFRVVITSPKTKQIIEGTTGERTDQILIMPRITSSNLVGDLLLPQPIQATKEYFSSEAVKNGLNSYLGSIAVNQRVGFQLVHADYSDAKYTLFQNSDGTWFVMESLLFFSWVPYSKEEMIEPYYSILGTLKFSQ